MLDIEPELSRLSRGCRLESIANRAHLDYIHKRMGEIQRNLHRIKLELTELESDCTALDIQVKQSMLRYFQCSAKHHKRRTGNDTFVPISALFAHPSNDTSSM
jgi:hypothetical protein